MHYFRILIRVSIPMAGGCPALAVVWMLLNWDNKLTPREELAGSGVIQPSADGDGSKNLKKQS
jgi:hypothetical protein